MYVALLFDDNLKKHEFIVHPKAAEFPHIMNALDNKAQWFLIQMIGPFQTKKEADYIKCLWDQLNAPRGYLLTIGKEICNQYNLTMWVGNNKDVLKINYPKIIKTLRK